MQLAVGNRRSYSDVAQLTGGGAIHYAGRKFTFDQRHGMLWAEGRCTLGEIARVTIPEGWFFPVTPGTRHATIGGCIANDVHGKNHVTHGSFGNHVEELGLVRPGRIAHLLPMDELFQATVGGLGLTGKIKWAGIRMEFKRAFRPWAWPLDYIPFYWPLYKALGCWQYHCVVPEKALPDLHAAVTQRPLLMVHKRFGDIKPVGMLSFCRPGISVSYDFLRRDEAMQKRLDAVVTFFGGAVYPAKTSMSKEMFRHSFPRWREFAKHVVFTSDFWKRVGV